MTFDWSNYLDLAKLLLQPRPNEAEDLLAEARLRAAISRAYYAAFGVAFEFAASIDPTLRSGTDNKHQKLINWYNQHQRLKRDYLTLSLKLKKLRDDRNKADYEAAPIPRIDTKANEVIMQADLIILTVKGLIAAASQR
jgi:uncharacterized protein (UPF0332 family)